jgi:hypothetical protein
MRFAASRPAECKSLRFTPVFGPQLTSVFSIPYFEMKRGYFRNKAVSISYCLRSQAQSRGDSEITLRKRLSINCGKVHK